MRPDRVLTSSPSPKLSLRWRLSLSYAAIALLTAGLLGGILIGILANYFSRVDADHLRAAADRAATSLEGADGPTLLESARLTAFGTNTRIQIFGADGALLADSGSPQLIDPNSVQFPGNPSEGPKTSKRPPTEPGSSGSPDEARSQAQVTRPVPAGSRGGAASVRASEAVWSGAAVMTEILAAVGVAASIAVLAAALIGYWISSRVSRRIASLSKTSDDMANGDLSVRSHVSGGDEVGRLASSFNQMAARVEATIAALQRFVSDAAHQIGTPLTALRTDLEVLRESTELEEERRLLDRALTQEARLEGLSAGLLQLSRLESPTQSASPVAVDVCQLIRECVDSVASRAEQADLQLTADLPTAAVHALVDPDRLRQSIENLLDNAIKFTPRGGAVVAGAAVESAEVVVWVADTGVGIPTPERARVFERFYRSPAVSSQPGSGLGLAIVAAAMHSIGGTVVLADAAVGTRVELHIPLAKARRPTRSI